MSIIHDNKLIHDEFLKKPYRVHVVLFLLFIVQGFIHDTPMQILQGTWTIFISPDILITDYVYTGGVGAAFVNVGLTGLLSIAAFKVAKHEPSGLTIGTLGVVIGMSFFGKNPANMIPIIMGGWVYSKYTGTPHRNSVIPSVLATCLAPAVTQLAFVYYLPTWLGIFFGICIGLFIGFIMTPFAAALRKSHEGFNLYNVGFAAGILGLGLFAVFRTLGVDQSILPYWSSGHNFELSVFLLVMSLYYIICGALTNDHALSLKELISLDADDYDYFKKYSEKAYISMGLLGLGCYTLMLVTGAEYSGPVLGGAVSVIGFGAFGKSLVSSAIIASGAMMAAVVSSLFTPLYFNHRGFMLAVLFSTCLAPIAKRFGWKWGLLAGFVHLSLATNVGIFHGGMNLYNNGFAGGLTAMTLIPIIHFFEEQSAKRRAAKRKG